jgi:hypothetical protein
LHAVVGTKTNVIAACKVGKAGSSDTGHFPPLATETVKNFTVAEMSADKAYTTYVNFELAEKLGFKFYSSFKVNAVGQRGGAYARALHLMQLNKEDYDAHYHKRSNVESAFSALKRKMGADLRSKNDRAMRNETYAKVVAYNITCVIGAMYELGISPLMGCTKSLAAAHKVAYGED